jgi:hypothetical protein
MASVQNTLQTRTPTLKSTDPRTLKLIIEKGSLKTFLGTAKTAAKPRPKAPTLFARVLLNWYINGKHFDHTIGYDEAPVAGKASTTSR